MKVLQFPRDRRLDIAVAACARIYERARASGAWQRSRLVRAVWMKLVKYMIRKANQ